MKYNEIVTASFIRRLNRFVAHVELEGREETVHVKNTGRCAELLLPGATVILEKAAPHAGRRTAYSLIAVYKGDLLINMDSQAPNRVIGEAAREGRLNDVIGGAFKLVKQEVTFGKSRFDLYGELEVMEQTEGPAPDKPRRLFMEVKGVTLEEDGIVRFPDAPTERGTKHVLEMVEAVRQGYEGYIMFLIQMKGVQRFEPNDRTDPAFAKALRTAAEQGVRIIAFDAEVTPDSMVLGQPVPVHLDV